MTRRCRSARALRGPLAVAALLAVAGAGCTAPEEPVVRSDYKLEPRDVVLVLDTSCSMNANDPNRLAVYATSVFADLTEQQDRLVVVTFPTRDVPPSNGGGTRGRRSPVSFEDWIATEQNRVGPLPASELKVRVKELPYTSQFTVFTEPLDKALRVLDDAEGRGSKAIVIFSDGDTDRFNDGTNHLDNHDAERLAMDERLDGVRRRGARFFGMTLGEARHDQFDALAAATGGSVETVERPEDLVDNFAEVFSKILETRVENFTFHKGAVQPMHVRRYVKELIFLVPDGSPDIQIRMQEPRASRMKMWEDGRSIDTSIAAATIPGQCVEAGICRVDDATRGAGEAQNRYSVLRVPWPTEGEWKVDVTSGPDGPLRTLMVQNYDLYLEVTGEQQREGWMGEKNRFLGRLVNGRGEVIADPELFAGASYHFEARDRATGELVEQREIAPDDKYRMVYDFVPQSEQPLDVTITLTSGDWLTRRVFLEFTAVKDIKLVQATPADFGAVVPWTDRFIETLGGAANVLLPFQLWEPGDRIGWRSANDPCTRVDFSGSARQARGVAFQLDNTRLREELGARVTDRDGNEEFALDSDYTAELCVQALRGSGGGALSAVSVPIRSSSGREVSGTTALSIGGTVERLPAAWARWWFWIPIETYILLRLLKILVFWWLCSWGRTDGFTSRRQRDTRVFRAGLFGVHRIPIVPRLLMLPVAAVVSQFNFLRVGWALLTWANPPVPPTMSVARWSKRKPRLRKGEDPLPRQRRLKLALLGFVMDGLLFSIWLGRCWRPPLEVGRRVLVVKNLDGTYFCETDGADPRWRMRGESLAIKGANTTFHYDVR